MSSLSPDFYFDLSSFKHQAVFDTPFVWTAITQISLYLKTLPLGQILTEVPAGAHLIDRETIFIGRGTVVEPGAYIKGPCYIGENCTIRHGAYLRGDVLTGDYCVLGHDSEFKNALLLNHAHAAHFAYVGDSILGNHVNLGAGTVCANLKLDRSPVIIHADGRRVETGLKKFGAILGDGAQTGCNSVLNPGTLFGKHAMCYPCLNIGGMIPPNQIIRKNQ